MLWEFSNHAHACKKDVMGGLQFDDMLQDFSINPKEIIEISKKKS